MNIKNRRKMELTSGHEPPRLTDGNVDFEIEDYSEASEERKGIIIGFCVFSSFLFFLLAMIFIICLSGSGEAEGDSMEVNGSIEEKETVSVDVESVQTSFSLTRIYEKCIDGVVSISVKGQDTSSIGSGFIYSEDGYVATAAHVLEGGEDISVILADGTRLSAEIVDENALSDIALLKIKDTKGKKLSTLELGSSAKLDIGQKVAAIGTPASLDYAGSVSSGEISYIDRVVKIYSQDSTRLEKKMRLIQTTAPLNPGNSGCPLLDDSGKVIGMVTMKLGNNFSGMGFAIPGDSLYRVLNAMKNGIEINEELLSCVVTKSAKLGVEGTDDKEGDVLGVRITDFSDLDCDAALKLKKGDLIVGFDGAQVGSASAIIKIIEEKSPKESVSVTVIRSGQRLTFDVQLSS